MKQDFTWFVIYRREDQAMLEINFQEVDELTRLVIEYTTPEEFAAMEKRWEEEEKKAKEGAEERSDAVQ